MKKLLLIVSAAMLALSATAQLTISEVGVLPKSSENSPATSAPAKAEAAKELAIQYCGDFSDAAGYEEAGVCYAAIQCPTERAQSLKGNKIERVRIALGKLRETKTMTIWFKKDLYEEPVLSETVTIKTTGGWADYTLTTPYLIDGEEFYIGYTVKALGKTNKDTADAPYGVDGAPAVNSYSDYVGYDEVGKDGKTQCAWGHIGDMGYNTNLCIAAFVTGDNLPQYDIETTFAGVKFEFRGQAYDYTYVKLGDKIQIYFEFRNIGSQPLKGVDVIYQYADNEPEVMEVPFNRPLEYGSGSYLMLAEQPSECGINIPIRIEVVPSGYDDPTPSNNVKYTYVNVSDASFKRNSVFEELTSTYCSWCPRGIVGMEYMNATYPDFIGIAVHGGITSPAGKEDPMVLHEYFDRINKGQGQPGCYVNRNGKNVDPSKYNLENEYLKQADNLSLGAIFIDDVKISNGKATVTTSQKVMYTTNSAALNIAYVITEDHVGPYEQRNAYSGRPGNECDGWEQFDRGVQTYFNDVARYISNFDGKPSGIPTEAVADKVYHSTDELPLDNVTDITNMNIIAMLLDRNNGEIVNAAKWKYTSGSSVTDIATDAEEIATTYVDLLGRPVANPSNGIFIKSVTYSDGSIRTSKVAL